MKMDSEEQENIVIFADKFSFVRAVAVGLRQSVLSVITVICVKFFTVSLGGSAMNIELTQ
jgi:hypothetical protein